MNKKNLLIAVAALLFSIQIQAQAPAKEKEQSNAEVFSSKAGTLMQKEFVEIGTLKKAKVQVLYYTDLISNMKKSALKFELPSILKLLKPIAFTYPFLYKCSNALHVSSFKGSG